MCLVLISYVLLIFFLSVWYFISFLTLSLIHNTIISRFTYILKYVHSPSVHIVDKRNIQIECVSLLNRVRDAFILLHTFIIFGICI
jgi:hypothetical protein